MDVQQLLSRITDDLTPKRVFGEPISQDGVMLVPVARVRGGAGAGSGGPEGEEGTGGGAGIDAKGLGVFVVKDGKVSWQPAIDVTRIAIGGQVLALVFVLVIRSVIRRRR
ncbi:spore germination protein GerW family protein [Pedococcus sp. NPDC057267]|uniref:spore germination protein GerW family protein n=1 Tax=Pedococcus sp. NPDC057267 TaxID=3346077 RepID=UPI00362E7F73